MSILKINGVSCDNLKENFGTPLYIYDENKLIDNINEFKNNFKSNCFKTKVIFASKSFNVKAMLRLVKEYNLGLDCVSLGELYTANMVNFNHKDIYLHGNNKSDEEILYSIENNVNIVVDNICELERIKRLANDKDVNLFIRINVGVEAHTHKYIVTSDIDSKFGVIYNSDDYKKILEIINNNKNLNLVGLHSHIGSQIFDLSGFAEEIKRLVSYCKDFSKPISLDLGGGFGVFYTSEDAPKKIADVCHFIIECVIKYTKEFNIKLNEVLIEPGRAIVAEAGYTLYTIGDVKRTPHKLYYFIDGGMTDNIRPALYQAKYRFDVATKIDCPKDEMVCIAGKCCESGDILAEMVVLPKATSGDLLISYTTGAYGYSMSSNYNKALTPGVVFIKDGKAREVVKRQTLKELIEREI